MTDTQYLNRLEIAVSLRREGMYALALQVASGILSQRPEEYAVHHTLGQIYTEIGEFGKSLLEHEEAFRLLKASDNPINRKSEYQTCALGLAQARMRLGLFDYGTWPLWEAGRCGVSWSPYGGACFYTGMEESVTSLLVQLEGGYGDAFMFSRWLPLLKEQKNVKRLGLMVWNQLIDWDWASLGVDEVFCVGRDIIPMDHSWEYATSIMSMPALFNVQKYADIPAVVLPSIEQYAHEARAGESQHGRPLRLGFCWRAEENTSPVRTKSLPVSVASEVISLLPAVGFYSLSPQHADLYSAGAFTEPDGMWVDPERMKGFKATAEYIQSMDFILTVDTAVAHLSGLLGVPALVLLPRSSCWRWGFADRLSGPWYGPQLTYYRQPEPLVWDARAIVHTLQERLK